MKDFARIDKKEFDADFVSNFNNAVIFVLKTLKTEYIIEKVEREEKPEIPESVLRELIINAMIHRDYFSEGRVIIEIYSDRFEISNPGELLFKKSDLGKISLSRNPLLVDLVHRLRLVERIGSGILRIQELMKDRITFDTNSDWFFAKINRNVPVNVPVNRLDKIKEIITQNNTMTISEIASILQVNEKTIKRDIEKLKQKNLIRRIGSDKTGHWEVL